MNDKIKMDLADFVSKFSHVKLEATTPQNKPLVTIRSYYPACIQSAIIQVLDYLVKHVNILYERFILNFDANENMPITIIMKWHIKEVIFETIVECSDFQLNDFPRNFSHEYVVGAIQDIETKEQININFIHTEKTEASGIRFNKFTYPNKPS